jgi:nucleoside-specific outer membrane channel protein Tsx
MKLSVSRLTMTAVLALVAHGAMAAEWSDTSLGYRYGQKFAEPYGPNDISKSIFSLTHASGYKYGTNYFNADLLLADDKDPSAPGAHSGSQETYVLYRNTLDFGKISGSQIAFGPVRGVGLTLGFDWNTKSDAGYNSKKRMLVAGPTLMFDVPGFFNTSLLVLNESNAPYNGYTHTSVPRYTYKTHAMLSNAWSIPFNVGIPLSFEGYANFISSKGKDEFGGDTKPETHFDMQIMYDMSAAVGAGKNTFKVGVEYEYWKNKFGNDDGGPAGSGATAKTPMVRAEYHF